MIKGRELPLNKMAFLEKKALICSFQASPSFLYLTSTLIFKDPKGRAVLHL
jgi:hypothetical protein